MATNNPYEQKMNKTIEVLADQFSTIRAGKANASVLGHISVPYYGVQTALSAIGTISTPDPRTLVIQPWDTSVLKDIEKAIQASDLGINPQNDGKIIRLSFPQLTEERRKELIKTAHRYAEEAKVATRNIRRDAMEDYKAQKKKGEITEDDLKDYEKETQDITDKKQKEIDVLLQKKEKELLEI